MKVLLSSVAAIAIGSAAFAGGVVTPPPAQPPVVPPVSVYDWSGGYVGLQFGLLHGELELEGENLNNNNTMSEDFDIEGHEIGIYAGYNWMNGNMVYGIEAELNHANAEGDGPGVAPPSFGFIGGGIEGTIESTGALRARVGYAMDRSLVYGTFGVAFADVNVNGTPRGGTGTGPFDQDETMTGLTVGVGYERALSDTWTMRIDYRYSDLEADFSFDSGQNTPHDFTVGAQTHELRLGAAYRF